MEKNDCEHCLYRFGCKVRPILTENSVCGNEFHVQEEYDENVRSEAIEKCAETMSHISNICGASCPAKCHWGTELTCKEAWKDYLMEKIKGEPND